jgi:hypothetical protein
MTATTQSARFNKRLEYLSTSYKYQNQLKKMVMKTKVLLLFLIFLHNAIIADQNLDNKSAYEPALDISQKNKLSGKQLEDKKEDGYFTFIVGPISNPDAGFGGGGVLNYYYNGKRTEDLFPYVPYKHRLTLVVSYQSRGNTVFDIQWDAPYFLHSPFRIFADFSYNMNPVASFYGIGEKTLQPLHDQTGNTYTRMDNYDATLRSVKNGNTMAYYNYFSQRWFDGRLMVQRDFSGGVFRILGGYLIKNYTIRDYSSQKVDVANHDGSQVHAVMGDTILYNEYQAGKISGFTGGWNNAMMASLVFDNRDYEPNAHRGMFHDITLLHQANWLGSDFNYSELTAGSRFYFTPFETINFVIAARMAASYKFGQNIPFFGLTTMQFSNIWTDALGDTRGYRKSRFLAPFTTLANLEFRYTFLNWKWGRQLFSLSIAPFVDVVSVFDQIKDFNFDRVNQWKSGYGAGIRLVWNQATVIRFDFGFSSEDFGFYLYTNHMF